MTVVIVIDVPQLRQCEGWGAGLLEVVSSTGFERARLKSCRKKGSFHAALAAEGKTLQVPQAIDETAPTAAPAAAFPF
jgi:hypothetical protein